MLAGWPLIVNTSTDKMTLSAGLAALSGQHGTDYPLAMAGALLGVLPMLIMFIIFQKKFIEGMASTGIKWTTTALIDGGASWEVSDSCRIY